MRKLTKDQKHFRKLKKDGEKMISDIKYALFCISHILEEITISH